MSAFVSHISMPVVRVDSDRNDDDQSKKEKHRQLERQLPRMRIAEKNRSEKILASAMQAGETRKSVQEFSTLPRPAVVKNKNHSDDFNHDPSRKSTVNNYSINKENLNHTLEKNDDSRYSKFMKSTDVSELHGLEDRLHQRDNPISLAEMLDILKNTDKKLKNDKKSEIKAKQDAIDQVDMLCSLDFLGGYVSASAEMPAIRAEIMEVIGSLRQQVTNHQVDAVTNIALQHEGLVQLLSDSETQYSVRKDASGHQKLVIEVSESRMNKIMSPLPQREKREAASDPIGKPGEDSLPLVVQRSV